MRAADPTDLKLILHDNLSDSYERSTALLATAAFDGTLQLLTAGWERSLGYRREDLQGKTLLGLTRCRPAAAVAAMLDTRNMRPVELNVRCRDGLGKRFRLHRRYDRDEHVMYMVAEEIAIMDR